MAAAPRPPAAAAATARLFVALWPDEATRAAIAAHAEGWCWPAAAARVRSDKLHLTLHFLGALPRERMPALVAALAELPAPACDLVLQRVMVWRSGVAVLCPLAAPAPLLALHAAVGERLAALGLPTERRPWRPHVTLARRAYDASASPARLPIHWRPGPPVLVESERIPPGGYRVVDAGVVS